MTRRWIWALAGWTLFWFAGPPLLPWVPSAVAPAAAQILNPTGHDVRLTVPVMDGNADLGDIALVIDNHDKITIPALRLLDLLSEVLTGDVIAKLRQGLAGSDRAGLDAVRSAGIAMHYDPQKIELQVNIPASWRLTRTLQIAPVGGTSPGGYQVPATVSGYINLRTALGLTEQGADAGRSTVAFFLDGAARYQDIVLEGQATWRSGLFGGFLRQASRLVYDDVDNIMRFSVGDLSVTGQGFQGTPDIAGFSVARSYGILQPQMLARPTGRQSFELKLPSTVEVWVNGRLVRRLRLDPGNYDLRDFPFTQGVDDVRVSIADDGGGTQNLNFSLFSDQLQLAQGLSEFGLYAGVETTPGANGPIYSSVPAVTGFYRRGFSDWLTLGTNIQADERTQMGGLDAILSTNFGAFGGNVSASSTGGSGLGFASAATFHTEFNGGGASSDAINLSAEYWSPHFSTLGAAISREPLAWRFNASFSHAFDSEFFAGTDLHYSKDWAAASNNQLYRIFAGWRPNQTFDLTADANYQNAASGTNRLSFHLVLTMQLGSGESASVGYDSREQEGRISYQVQRGQGAGAFDATGTLEWTPRNIGVNGSADYYVSAGELGLDQFNNFGAGTMMDARTTLRLGASAAFADGAFSIGRPITDGFAIVDRLANLKGAQVTLNPSSYGYTAGTTFLGTATEPDLSAYSERTITIDAPDAAQDADLGPGAFRVRPPYRGGYRLDAGSEYPVTAIGRLLAEDGTPLALTSGTAIEVAAPGRNPIELFTNRDGRFGVTGVRAGRWRIHMLTSPETDFLVTIPADATGAVRIGDIKPESRS